MIIHAEVHYNMAHFRPEVWRLAVDPKAHIDRFCQEEPLIDQRPRPGTWGEKQKWILHELLYCNSNITPKFKPQSLSN